MVRQMALRWPNEPALSLAFAVTSAAATFEDIVDSEMSKQSARKGYRLAALVSADVFAVQAMGQVPAMTRDLLHFWRRVDPYFLNL